jgi:hypothetical protein
MIAVHMLGGGTRIAVLMVAISGCGFSAQGNGHTSSSGGSSGDETTTGDPTASPSTATTAGTSTTQGQTTTATTTTTTAGGSTGSASGATTGSVSGSTGAADLPPSCQAQLDAEPGSADGYYSLATMAGTPFTAYCDMTIDGGGWTLVGRSDNQGSADTFGWMSSTGTVDDLSAPYSLDVVAHDLSFTEILVADRVDEHQASVAYRVDVPADFLTTYGDSAYQVQTIDNILGTCSPSGGPEMLQHFGYVDQTDHFHFRDIVGSSLSYGLFGDGFEVFWGNCSQGGDLDEQQGMIFVR